MEPASAIGIASSVIAFLEFGVKVISAAKTIYDSKDGILPQHAAIEQHIRDLLASSPNLNTKSSGKVSAEELRYRELSSRFRKDCQAIIDLLAAHRCNGGKRRHRVLSSVKAAFKLPGIREQLHEIEQRLDKTQRAMQLHVFQQLRQEISDVHVAVDFLRGHGNTKEIQHSFTAQSENNQVPPLPSLHDLKGLREQLSGMLQTLEALRVESILASLNYETRQVRHDTIKNAHAKTFEWALDSSFAISRWLRSGDGFFWVSGKPGSGKSTLMTFLAGHPRTKSFLEDWSGGNELIVASHYFWWAGTPMQKSYDGLLRSLLFDIFRRCPSSIQEACPERWAKAGAPRAAFNSWTVAELGGALRAVALLQSSSPLRFCFFIDGLDEYDGDHLELCGILKELVQAGTIKMCLSSRPWPVFEGGLGKDLARKLYVQDLTFDDIKLYVTEQLDCHPNWTTNLLTEEERENIIRAITTKASGVFLWVYLVTKSLREGLSNYDTVIDLTRRLEQLPSDLEKLFRRMLESVNPVYQSKMACFLQAATADQLRDDLHSDAEIYCNMERELDNPGYALREPSSHECSLKHDQMQHIINSRTMGILETRVMQDNLRPPIVQFFHRTMYDFVQTKEIQELITSKLPLSNEFNIHLWLMKAHLITRKEHRVGLHYDPPGHIVLDSDVQVEVFHMLRLAAEALATLRREHFEAVFALLDEYENALRDLRLHPSASWASSEMLLRLLVSAKNSRRLYDNPASYFREVAVCSAFYSPIHEYIEPKIIETGGAQYLEAVDVTLILHLAAKNFPYVRLWFLGSSMKPCHARRMVQLLLGSGIDPNKHFVGQDSKVPRGNNDGLRDVLLKSQVTISPWVLLMRTCVRLQGFSQCSCSSLSISEELSDKLLRYLPIINVYLDHWARPNEEFCGRPKGRTLQCCQKQCPGPETEAVFGIERNHDNEFKDQGRIPVSHSYSSTFD
ncbi:hypothetical protein B0T20DRAFT_77908 [Sordaria brevicollis]|uniref:NACHT domain-containing protein n=1 Tax=Sordaria brevicollis TaxID=83679 RepID=A0AAE0P1N3_SORBR|nr:hypothetical protein B0T20DRAFT_77908 [Sordaria brevicollis]